MSAGKVDAADAVGPRTEAGRRLLAANEKPGMSYEAVLRAILAIEAEAARGAEGRLAAIREAARKLREYDCSDMGGFVRLYDVLALLKER